MIERLKRHSKTADETAIATELHKAAEFRRGMRPCLHSADCADVLLATELKDKQNLKMRCEAWLKPANMKAVHHFQVQAKLQGTCEWIWTNSTFQEWNASSSQVASDRILAIHGIHGCGKTVLASSVISGFDTQGQRRLFFSFSGTDAARQSTNCLVRSFIWQLLRDDPDGNGLDAVKDLILKGEPLESELWDAFSKIMRQMSVYCVVDGIDECIESCQSLIVRLLCILAVEAKVKVIILGRLHALEPLLGGAKYKIEMSESLIKQDIDAYIASGIGHHDLLSLPQLQKPVSERLQESAGGMFLWAKLMIDHLGRSANQAQVLRRLQDVPHGLDKAYSTVLSRLVDQLDPHDLSFVKNILALMITSIHSLNIEESQCAQALISRSPDTFEERLEHRQKQKILDLCGGLVIVMDEHLRLVHFSLKEFLIRPMNVWTQSNDSSLGAFRVNVEHAHQSLGAGGIGCLSIAEYGLPTRHGSDLPLALVLGLLQTTAAISLHQQVDMLITIQSYPQTVKVLTGPLKPLSRTTTSKAAIIPVLVLVAIGEFYFSVNKLDKSLEVAYAALKKLDGQETPMKYSITGKIARILRNQQKYQEAEPFSRQTWLGRRHILGQDHKDTLQAASELCFSLGHLRRYREAEVLGRQTLMDRRKVLGDEHPDTLCSASSLSYYLSELGRHGEAEVLGRQTLTARRRVLGDEHPDTLHGANRLSYDLSELGRYGEAEALGRQTLMARRKVLGDEHPDTLLSADNLSCYLSKLGRHEEAEVLGRQTLMARRKVLGDEHPDTLRSANRLSYNLSELGRYEEAEVLGRQTLMARRKVLGDEHPDTLLSADNLSCYLSKLGRHEEAEVLGRQTLMARRKVLGDEHPDTLRSANRLSYGLSNLRRYEEAEALGRQTLMARRKVLGDEHPDTLCSASNLSYYLSKLGRHKEAEVLGRQTLMARRKAL